MIVDTLDVSPGAPRRPKHNLLVFLFANRPSVGQLGTVIQLNFGENGVEAESV